MTEVPDYIHMETVTSSNVEAIGYHAGSKTLRVRYRSGWEYDYPDVEAGDHAELMKPETSKGKYIDSQIAPTHPYKNKRKV